MSTMNDVRKMWEFYKQGASAENHLRARMSHARDQQARRCKDSAINFTALRSTKPALPTPSLLEDLDALCKHYWKHGSIEIDSQVRAKQSLPNATLLTLEDEATLHYGTDPLLGFHLATAIVSAPLQTPVAETCRELSSMEKLVAAAKFEFSEWAKSLRENQSNITLRFFVGEAMSFCHTLQHKRVSGSETAGWFRRPNRFDPVILDGPDYASSKAPLRFDIIDTSNLCDHLGPLSLLAAASPLLSHRLTSALYTEVLSSIHTHKDLLGGIVCGHLPTMSALLGLFPVEYWTNTSTLSSGDEGLSIKMKDKSKAYVRTCWKRPTGMSGPGSHSQKLVPIEFDSKELASVMFEVYINMFCDEDYAHKFANLGIDAIKNSDIVLYQRSNFVSLLRLVKTRVSCDWESTMQSLLTMIELRQNAPMDSHYIQELCLFLHESGVFSVDILKEWQHRNSRPDSLFKPFTSSNQPGDEKWGDVRDWKNIPPVVCVTMKVPRKNLSVLTSMTREELGTPTVHGILQGPNLFNGWQNLFRTCQLAFGEISTSGTRFQDSFAISVAEDGAGWKGSAPLLASFYVPSHVLFLEPQKATVGFGIHSTFASSRFVSKLGPTLSVYGTTLGNSASVFITRYAPNQKCFPIVPGFANSDLARHEDVAEAHLSLRAKTDPAGGHVIIFTGRLDIMSDDHKSSLQSGKEVKKSMPSPFQVAITIGNTTPLNVNFPVCIVEHGQRIRVARKSSYVEVIAQVAGPSEWAQYPNFMFPVYHQGNPVNWNMSRAKLERCPAVDLKQSGKANWLVPHLGMAMSARERALREDGNLPQKPGEQTRLRFKDSLFSLFIQFAGVQGAERKVFGIHNPRDDRTRIVVLPSTLRIDPSTRAAVLDCAIFPLSKETMPALSGFLMAITAQGVTQLQANDAALGLWKHNIPAYVERCRTWEHRDDCEYVRSGIVPLTVEDHQPFLCTCGNGKFPADYLPEIALWSTVSQYGVRAAISPAFWAPYGGESHSPGLGGLVEPVDGNRCSNCRKEEGKDGIKLRSCGNCMKVRYCSRECQRAHWKTHKATCKK